MDFPAKSVLIAGLDDWEGVKEEVLEPRLVEKLRTVLQVNQLRLFRPPAADDGPQSGRSWMAAWEFPEWFITQDVLTFQRDGTRTRRLVHRKALEGGKWRDDDKKKHTVVPIRFVRACPAGHIGDIDWIWFAHSRQGRCTSVELFIDEKGSTGDISEISIRCRCGAVMPLSLAAAHKTYALGPCDGRRPWLGPANNFNREPCEKKPNRLLVRNASNAYFPQVMSVISLPDRDDALDNAIDLVWDFLEDAEGPHDVKRERKKQKVRDALDGFTDEQTYQAIEAKRTGGADTSKTVKQAEFEVLAAVTKETAAETLDQKFTARLLPKARWVTSETPKSLADAINEKVERVVLVDRLRDVVAQVGFTRFEAVSADTEGELRVEELKRASLAREVTWLPAVENKGEGFFLQFKKGAVEEWKTRPEVKAREALLARGFVVWKADRPESGREFPNSAYLLMHTLSHLLMTAVSLECGYPSSSLRERVYALESGYGILIYTGTSDAEGTLGGLVEAGKHVARHLETALRLGGLCSNDPVCAQHDPVSAHEGRHLHGSACHGCVLTAETSCERHNDFLDRALVVPTVEQLGCEFFPIEAI